MHKIEKKIISNYGNLSVFDFISTLRFEIENDEGITFFRGEMEILITSNDDE